MVTAGQPSLFCRNVAGRSTILSPVGPRHEMQPPAGFETLAPGWFSVGGQRDRLTAGGLSSLSRTRHLLVPINALSHTDCGDYNRPGRSVKSLAAQVVP
jgi:hypothetical protein